MTEAERLREAIDAACRRLVAFPYAQVCKHYAVLILGEELERRGFEPNVAYVRAVVNADDEAALAEKSIFKKAT